jgi:putative NADPH-quinone reductase
MKILAIQGSPRMKKGYTDKCLQTFLAGAKEAGADTETVYLSKMNIKYCTGCFNCWIVTPGKCIYRDKDDMLGLLQSWKGVDVMIWATPVYIDGVSAQLKTMMDRMLPGALPYIDASEEGHSQHPSRRKAKEKKKLLLMSTCGFGEIDNFDPMVMHIKAAVKNMADYDYAGALLRPMAGGLDENINKNTEKVQEVLDAYTKAGKELVTEGVISEESFKAVSVPLMSMKELAENTNAFIDASTGSQRPEAKK